MIRGFEGIIESEFDTETFKQEVDAYFERNSPAPIGLYRNPFGEKVAIFSSGNSGCLAIILGKLPEGVERFNWVDARQVADLISSECLIRVLPKEN